VRERSPGDKPMALRRRGVAVVAEPLDDALAAALCLDDARLAAMHALAERCERAFGGMQDLEWAFAGDTLWLLQRRPITVLASGA
jgi:pyruvate,water dikinase